VQSFGDLETLAPLFGAARGLGRSQPAQLGQKHQLLDDLHALVEAAFLGQIADTPEGLAGPGFAEERDRARVRQGDPNHHADGGGFAGAIRPQQAEHAARLDFEAQVFDGNLLFVRLGNALQFDQDFHGDSPEGQGIAVREA
jgi:hypothetical protein